MKKLFSVLLALLLVLSLSATVFASAQETFLLDEADLLTDSEEYALTSRLRSISNEYGAQIIVATMPSLQGWDIDSFIEYAYDTTGFGFGTYHDGVMLLIAMEEREYRILSNGLAGDAIGGSEIDAISDAIVSDLSAGCYADAFDAFADRCAYYLNGAINGYPFNVGGNLLGSLAIGLLVGVIVSLVLKGQLRSVKRQDQAGSYVRDGSMRLTSNTDLFLYRNIHRTRRQTSSSSGGSRGGGGSRHVGGGKF